MNKQDAVKIIKELAESIKTSPSQFQFTVNITGTSVNASNGSTGMIVNAVGGESGSNTIGYNSTMDGNQIEIARKSADSSISQQMSQLYDTLLEISEKLDAEDKDTVEKLYNSLKNTWVPGVITSILGNLLTLTLGTSV